MPRVETCSHEHETLIVQTWRSIMPVLPVLNWRCRGHELLSTANRVMSKTTSEYRNISPSRCFSRFYYPAPTGISGSIGAVLWLFVHVCRHNRETPRMYVCRRLKAFHRNVWNDETMGYYWMFWYNTCYRLPVLTDSNNGYIKLSITTQNVAMVYQIVPKQSRDYEVSE